MLSFLSTRNQSVETMPTPRRTQSRFASSLTRSVWDPKPTVGVELGVSGIKLTLAVRRKNRPVILQQVRRRFPEELTFATASSQWLYDQIRQELPQPADKTPLRAVAVLSPSLAVYSLQQQPTPLEAHRIAASEMIGGAVELSRISADVFAAYVCPSQVSQSVVEAIESAGYNCDEIISHPSTLRYATVLAGNPSAAILDWGWQGCVLSLAATEHPASHLSRNFANCGMHSIIENTSNSLGAPLRMADHYLQRSATKAKSERRFVDALQPHLVPAAAQVAEQIAQTLKYARRFQIPMPPMLFLCGGGALLPSMCGLLEERLGIPVRTWSLAVTGKHAAALMHEAAWAVSAAAALMPVDNNSW